MSQDWLKYKLYIFDLDNTLYQETDYLFAAYRQIAMHVASNDGVLADEYASYLCESFLQEGRQGLFQRFRAHFKLDLSIDEVLAILRSTKCRLQLFPQMREVLSQLLTSGKEIAILTNGNKEQQMQKIGNLDLSQIFPTINIVYAADIESKPSPKAVLELMINNKTSPADVVLIGDSDIDKQTALNAGIDFINVCYFMK